MSLNEDIGDQLIGHRLELLRYEAGVAEELARAYDTSLAHVLAELAVARRRALAGRPIDPAAAARLNGLRADLTTQIRELHRVARLTLTERLAEVADFERAAQASLGDLVTTWTTVDEAAAATAVTQPIGGNLWTDRLATDLVAVSDTLQGTIAAAVASGASMPEIAKRIGQTTGLVETYRGRLIAIARTETQRVANTVALESYRQNADVLDGIQWLATLDTRTCVVCGARHGKVYPLGADGRPLGLDQQPPLHPRCRCFLSPVVVGVEAAPEMTFGAWLRRKGPSAQDEVLGPERAAMFRAGVPLDRFVDGRRALRMGELRAALKTTSPTTARGPARGDLVTVRSAAL